MAGIGLVNGENLKHVAVVLFQKTSHSAGVPILRRRTDRINAGGFGIEGRSGVQESNAVSSLELGHFDDLAVIGVWKSKDVFFFDKGLDLGHGKLRILNK